MPATEDGFTKFTVSEFEAWIDGVSVSRTINRIQHHHTFIPRYKQFSGSNHFAIQKGMRNHHVINNGWDDIGQHFTIFPDGNILSGRAMNSTPACIFGANARSICIESVGYFDTGGDTMHPDQKATIIAITAAIINRFPAIPVNDKGIVYHHWFDLDTGARRDGAGTTKSCPGSNFFGGNKVADFNANFLPLVKAALNKTPEPAPPMQSFKIFVVVTASFLNIRTGPNSKKGKITEHGPAERGSILRVSKEKNGWLKVSNSKNHWVYGRYTEPVEHGVVNTKNSNVHEGPGEEFDVIEVLNKGEDVFVQASEDDWLSVGPARWIHHSLIT